MFNMKWLLLAVLVVGTTACTSYQRPYGYNYNGSAQRWGYRDSDHDGVANRYDRDANGNGVPDKFERR
jgi:hypothetical protein